MNLHILLLQLDNTVKDMQSRYFMAYLQALVDCEFLKRLKSIFFKSVNLCDIGQLFSRIATYLKVSANFFNKLQFIVLFHSSHSLCVFFPFWVGQKGDDF